MRDDEAIFDRYQAEVSALVNRFSKTQVRYSSKIKVANHVFDIQGNSQQFRNFIEPSYRYSLCSPEVEASYEIFLFEGPDVEFSSPGHCWESVFSDRRPENSRSSRIFVTKDARFGYLPNLEILVGIDSGGRKIIFWTPNLNTLADSEYSAPLRLSFLWWANTLGIQMLHAGAVGGENGAVIIVGPSGQGKSTLSVASAVDGGLRFIGDDFVLASVDENPTVHSIYSSAKLDSSSLERFPELAGSEIRKTSSEKFLLDLTRVKEIQLAKSLPLKGVVLPNFGTNLRCELTPVPPSIVQLQMVPSTTVYSMGVERESFVRANKLLTSVPCFSYSYNCPKEAGAKLRKGLIEVGIEI